LAGGLWRFPQSQSSSPWILIHFLPSESFQIKLVQCGWRLARILLEGGRCLIAVFLRSTFSSNSLTQDVLNKWGLGGDENKETFTSLRRREDFHIHYHYTSLSLPSAQLPKLSPAAVSCFVLLFLWRISVEPSFHSLIHYEQETREMRK